MSKTRKAGSLGTSLLPEQNIANLNYDVSKYNVEHNTSHKPPSFVKTITSVSVEDYAKYVLQPFVQQLYDI